MEFGHNLRPYWNIDFEKIKFFNHGSFGATPKIILEKMKEIEYLFEKEPIQFYFEIYPVLLKKNISDLAKFLKTNYENLVLTENASSGVNTILDNFIPKLTENEAVYYTNHIYPAVRNTIKHKCQVFNKKHFEIFIDYPNISKEKIIEIIKKELNGKKGILVIDYISSPTSLIFPITEIIAFCKENGIKILVDAAHAPGMIELNLDILNPDWLVGNCHKWLFSGKGSAFIYSSINHLNEMHPLVISNDYGNGYRKEFDWIGTRNPSSWLTISDSIDFYNQFRFAQINNYNTELLKNTANLYLKELDFHINIDLSNYLWLISLPFPYFAELSNDISLKLRNIFYKKYGIEIMFVVFNNKLFIRYAAQIYNSIEDSKYLIFCIKDYIKNY